MALQIERLISPIPIQPEPCKGLGDFLLQTAWHPLQQSERLQGFQTQPDVVDAFGLARFLPLGTAKLAGVRVGL